MTPEDRRNLTALLMDLCDKEVAPLMDIKTNDRDFDGLKKLNDVKFSIVTVLEFIDSLDLD